MKTFVRQIPQLSSSDSVDRMYFDQWHEETHVQQVPQLWSADSDEVMTECTLFTDTKRAFVRCFSGIINWRCWSTVLYYWHEETICRVSDSTGSSVIMNWLCWSSVLCSLAGRDLCSTDFSSTDTVARMYLVQVHVETFVRQVSQLSWTLLIECALFIGHEETCVRQIPHQLTPLLECTLFMYA